MRAVLLHPSRSTLQVTRTSSFDFTAVTVAMIIIEVCPTRIGQNKFSRRPMASHDPSHLSHDMRNLWRRLNFFAARRLLVQQAAVWLPSTRRVRPGAGVGPGPQLPLAQAKRQQRDPPRSTSVSCGPGRAASKHVACAGSMCILVLSRSTADNLPCCGMHTLASVE